MEEPQEVVCDYQDTRQQEDGRRQRDERPTRLGEVLQVDHLTEDRESNVKERQTICDEQQCVQDDDDLAVSMLWQSNEHRWHELRQPLQSVCVPR